MKNISRLNNLQSISHPERKIWRFKKHEKANFWLKKNKKKLCNFFLIIMLSILTMQCDCAQGFSARNPIT